MENVSTAPVRGRITDNRMIALRWSREGKLQYSRHWQDFDTGLQGHEWIDVPTEEVPAGVQVGSPQQSEREEGGA